MASGHGVAKPNTAGHPARQVGAERFPDSRTTMVGPSADLGPSSLFSGKNVRGVTMDSYGAITTGRPVGRYDRSKS
jgi:hypothetical protein